MADWTAQRPRYYRLDGHKVAPCELREWADWFEGASRIVAKSEFGDVCISTVFLGIDHNFLGDGEPLIFETMVFGGPLDQWQERCSTWEQAENTHADACKLVKQAQTE